MFGEEPALEFTRVLGTSTAAMAEAAISMFAVSVAEPLRDAGAAPIEYAQRVRESTVTFTTARFGDRHHDAAAVRRGRRPLDRALGRTTNDCLGTRSSSPIGIRRPGRIDATHASRTTGEFAAAVRDFEGLQPKRRRGTARAS